MVNFVLRLAAGRLRPTVLLLGLILVAGCFGGPSPPKGETDGVPHWIPSLPGTEITVLQAGSSADKKSGIVVFSSADSTVEVEASLRSTLEGYGFDPVTSSFDGPEGSGYQMTAEHPKGHHGITITINGVRDGAEVIINYVQEI